MAGSPKYKVYRGVEYVAACKYPEDAAMLAGQFGKGGTVKYDHKLVVWFEGSEEFSLGDYHDPNAFATSAACIIEQRIAAYRERSRATAHGLLPRR